MCFLILLYRCARLAEERRRRAVLKSRTTYTKVRILLYLYYIRALILLYVCPHTAILCVLILLSVSSYCFVRPHTIMCPHTTFVVFITTQKLWSTLLD
jgi:hypothetical protein